MLVNRSQADVDTRLSAVGGRYSAFAQCRRGYASPDGYRILCIYPKAGSQRALSLFRVKAVDDRAPYGLMRPLLPG